MIKFTASKQNGETLIGLGLEEGNIERLKKGQPIVFHMSELGFEGMELMIMYGEDQDDIKAQLQKAGMLLPGEKGR